jgi:multidrug efflux system membrane fusion protein
VVKEKQVLFQIDPRPYQAKYDDAKAFLELQKARLKLARADNERARVTARTPGAISKQDLDKYQAGEEEARAAVNSAAASLEVYDLNLKWCKVESPITGRISRYFVTRGNLVTQDTTLLTTIVSENPIYAYFDVDERSVLMVRRRIDQGKIKVTKVGEIPVFLGLADEVGFPHAGLVNFINNRIDPLTGTITLRGEFTSPMTKAGRPLLQPGMFVRIRLPIGQPHSAVLIADRAVVTDQGLKNVYLLDSDNKVQYRRVARGALQPDGLRVIEEGLSGEERVLISGLQQLRPGMAVTPEEMPMPVQPAVPPPARGK